MSALPGALLALWLAPAPASAAEGAAPRIVVDPSSFDFGRVAAARTLRKQFVVRNHGRRDLEIVDLRSSCTCAASILDPAKRTLKPGGRAVVEVRFDTQLAPGPHVERVAIHSNDPKRPSVEVTLRAVVVEEP